MYTQVHDPTTNAVHETLIQRDADGAFIPFDDLNRDYREYRAWLDEGNRPNPPAAIPAPPVETPPPPDINEVNAQVQDIDARLSALEAELGR